MGNVVSSINVVSQLGLESSIGGGGAAGTKLRSLTIEPGDELTIREIQAAGHRFNTGTVIDKRWTSFQVSEAAMTYAEHLYCLENAFGTAGAPTVLGTQTQKRTYSVPITGSITPKTWVHQWGDPADNVNQYAYGLLTDYGESWDRESGVKQTGTKGLAQLVATGSSFTGSPRQLAEVPIAAGDFNIYLDTSWANLGITQITDEINMLDWAVNGLKSERWAANRGKPSFAGHVDVRPKTTVKFTIFEGSVARPIIASLEVGGIYFLRLDGQSSILIDNYQVLTVNGGPTGGTFTLTYKGQTTSALAYNATAATVQAALRALSTIGATGCSVAGSAGGPWTVTFAGALANDATLLTHTDSLTGGSSPNLTIAQTALPYLARRDFCVQLAKVSPLKDTKGVYGRELDLYIVEDPTSGNALVLTSQTAEATL